MKIITLHEQPRTIFENEKAMTTRSLMQEALQYGITDFTDADLPYFDLEGLVFVNCVFSRANFYKTRIQKVTFDTCHLEAAKFNQASTYRTLMRQCNLDKTEWTQTHIGPITMDFCTSKDANFVDLGMTVRGYKVVMSYENGQAIIRAGCREMTLQRAKEEYPETNNDEEGARVTLARRIAYQRGWLTKSSGVVVDKVEAGEIVQSFEELVKEDQAIMGIKPPDELPDETIKEEAQTVNA